MRITIVGAAGRLGRQLVTVASERGHQVTGMARHPAGFPVDAGRVEMVRGDARDPAALENAVRAADVVITTLPGGDRADLIARRRLWARCRSGTGDGAPPEGVPRVSTGELDRPTGLTRADTAAFLVELAETGTHRRAAINLRGRDAKG